MGEMIEEILTGSQASRGQNGAQKLRSNKRKTYIHVLWVTMFSIKFLSGSILVYTFRIRVCTLVVQVCMHIGTRKVLNDMPTPHKIRMHPRYLKIRYLLKRNKNLGQRVTTITINFVPRIFRYFGNYGNNPRLQF